MPVVLSSAVVAVFLTACFQAKPSDVAGGGGVETTGGAIASLSGNAAGARVRMIPAGYDPMAATAFPDSLETRTGADGKFTLRGLAPGKYNLDVWQPVDGTRHFQAGVVVAQDVSSTLPKDTLRAPARIRVHLEGVRRGFLFQPGTAYKHKLEYVEADSVTVILDSLPAGTLPPLFLDDPDAAIPVAASAGIRLTDSVRTLPGAMSEPGTYAPWAHQGTWSLDAVFAEAAAQASAQAGGGTFAAGDGYPVLLRLARPEFEFAEATGAGQDLRFTGVDGNVLPFEVERWDSAAGKAEIWVRLKDAQRSPREIRMHWGKPGARPLGTYGSVFDSASGFIGVWHLAEAGNNVRNGYKDATKTGLGGWGNQMKADAPDSGLAAGAQYFDGAGGNIRMGPGPLAWSGAMMVSAWIAPGFGNTETETRVILARWEEKDSAGFHLEYAPDIKGIRLVLGLASPSGIVQVDAPDIALTAGAWHHVAAAYDGRTATVYWDGRKVAQAAPGPAALKDNFRDLLIGAKGDVDPQSAETQFFLGRIDEVRILRAVKPAEWILLDLLIQKPQAVVPRLQRLR